MDESIELLKNGDHAEKKQILKSLNIHLLKVLLNVIYNVLTNKTYHISPEEKGVLKPFTSIYHKLLDKNNTLAKKKLLLQQDGDTYLPTFLEIIDEDIYSLLPKKPIRRRKKCPICKSVVKRLPNHLGQVHHLNKNERQEYQRDQNYDSGDESFEQNGSETEN